MYLLPYHNRSSGVRRVCACTAAGAGVFTNNAGAAAIERPACSTIGGRVLLVDFAFLHHEVNVLQFADIGERIAIHGDDIG
jgi:hypothetical protein